ncbi:MATH and LRR domain-containing protein PFE0570w-like [Culicoides brevitarsis]|uniref:MATH and LRR domain-containing protein PFE0570w-like n=1 Tax=Culicoides brevitarsis TaxID=469753 RepID=UPI00307C3618
MQMNKDNPIPSQSQLNSESIDEKRLENKVENMSDDLMADLDRLKDVELIDLLDDTTKSILESLKSLQSHYGINIDGLEVDNDSEYRTRAAELLQPDNKPAFYSSLTNILKRECSNGSILSLSSLNDRSSDNPFDMNEEKVNLIRSLSNLLKAESCINATIQAQSRSRLSSFTTSSENSVQSHKNKETEKEIDHNTHGVSRDSSISKEENTSMQDEPKEDDEIDFWACIKNEEDDLPPRKPFWSQSTSFSMYDTKDASDNSNDTELILQDIEKEELDSKNSIENLKLPNTDSKISESFENSIQNKEDEDQCQINGNLNSEIEKHTLEEPEKVSHNFENNYDNSKMVTNSCIDLHSAQTSNNAKHENSSANEIEPPLDFQDRQNIQNFPVNNAITDQSEYLLQNMYHNYYTNPALLSNPVYYHQYMAYYQYIQNLYYELNRLTEQINNNEQYHTLLNNNNKNTNINCVDFTNYNKSDSNDTIHESKLDINDELKNKNSAFDNIYSNEDSDVSTQKSNISNQNIDLVVEDHTELIEEAIVEGKILIIPSETVIGDSSISQEADISNPCTVIEKSPLEQSGKSEILVCEIDDNSYSTEYDLMDEGEQEIKSTEETENFEESEEETTEDFDCDDMPPLTYFKNNVNEHLPHQLSVIFEDNEYSERASFRSSSVDSGSDYGHQISFSKENKESKLDDLDVTYDSSSGKSLNYNIIKENESDVVKRFSSKQSSLEKSDQLLTDFEENDSVRVALSMKKNKHSNVNDDKIETSLNKSDKNHFKQSSNICDEQCLSELSNLDLIRVQPFNRSSSVPPSSSNYDSKSDEAIQRRFQVLRDQWSQLAKMNNEGENEDIKSSAWKITFFDANQDLFNTQKKEKDTPVRPQSCLPVPQTTTNWLTVDNSSTNSTDIYTSQTITHDNNDSHKTYICQEDSLIVNDLTRSKLSNNPLTQKIDSIASIEDNTHQTDKNIKEENFDSNSISEDECESEEIDPSTSHASLSESSYNSWKMNSSNTLKCEASYSNSICPSKIQSQYSKETSPNIGERARSCPRQSVPSDVNSKHVHDVLRSSVRPTSCTREMETKSENIRYIRASSITREPSVYRQNSQSFETDVRSSIISRQESTKNKYNQCINNDRNDNVKTTWEEYVPPKTDCFDASVRSLTELQFPKCSNDSLFKKKIIVNRPSSCTRELETIQNEKKSSSLYRKLSIGTGNEPYLNSCSFTTHPERPTSCTLELELNVQSRNKNIVEFSENKEQYYENPCEDHTCGTETSVVLRRRVKRQPRPVSCAGELEKQSYRNSLEGSRLEILKEKSEVSMPTVIEIHHNQPARPSSCTKELEGFWVNKNKNCSEQKPQKRAHSVSRDILLCTYANANASTSGTDANIEKSRLSVRDRVNAIEDMNIFNSSNKHVSKIYEDYSGMKYSIEESEADDDSGVQSSKYGSEIETDNEGFAELRKMTPYQRANTQTKLCQYLQECVIEKEEECNKLIETPIRQKKIVHNVSATRRQYPDKVKDAETPQERRQRLSLPLMHQHSSGIESVDSNEASPVRDKLVTELVQSLLLKKDGRQFRNIPLEKLHAAALKILEEEEEPSLAPSTVYSTPAQTPSEFQLDSPCSYEDYHASWQRASEEAKPIDDNYDYSVFPSKTFKRLHDQVCGGGTIVRRASSSKPSLLKSPSHANQYGTTRNYSPHSHSPSPFGT